MPLYFFGLHDDSPEASEELANDTEARQVAQIVADELSRNGREQVAVLVFNDGGHLIHKVWTRPHDATKSTSIFQEHVHPNGSYQLRATALQKP